MQSIIRELYSGEISPDSKVYEKDTAYQEAVRTTNGYLEKLTATLDESEKELLEKYSEARAVVDSMVNFDNFSYALRFGVMLMIEVLTKGGEGGEKE